MDTPNTLSSVAVKKLMNCIEEKLRNITEDPKEMDIIINGVWIERTTCNIRQHVMYGCPHEHLFDTCSFMAAIQRILERMREYNLSIDDIKCTSYPPEEIYPELILTLQSKEHTFKYYPAMISEGNCFDSLESGPDEEYKEIKRGVERLKASYCDLNIEENYKHQDKEINIDDYVS